MVQMMDRRKRQYPRLWCSISQYFDPTRDILVSRPEIDGVGSIGERLTGQPVGTEDEKNTLEVSVLCIGAIWITACSVQILQHVRRKARSVAFIMLRRGPARVERLRQLSCSTDHRRIFLSRKIL